MSGASKSPTVSAKLVCAGWLSDQLFASVAGPSWRFISASRCYCDAHLLLLRLQRKPRPLHALCRLSSRSACCWHLVRLWPQALANHLQGTRWCSNTAAQTKYDARQPTTHAIHHVSRPRVSSCRQTLCAGQQAVLRHERSRPAIVDAVAKSRVLATTAATHHPPLSRPRAGPVVQLPLS